MTPLLVCILTDIIICFIIFSAMQDVKYFRKNP